MSNRLLIKSVICSYSQDVYKDVSEGEGEDRRTSKRLVSERLDLDGISRKDISYKVNANTIDVTTPSGTRTLQISEHSEQFRGRD